MRFLSWEFWDFADDTIISEDSLRSPKSSEEVRRRPKSAEGEVIQKTLIHKIRDREEGIVISSFTHGFRSLHAVSYTHLTLPTNREV